MWRYTRSKITYAESCSLFLILTSQDTWSQGRIPRRVHEFGISLNRTHALLTSTTFQPGTSYINSLVQPVVYLSIIYFLYWTAFSLEKGSVFYGFLQNQGCHLPCVLVFLSFFFFFNCGPLLKSLQSTDYLGMVTDFQCMALGLILICNLANIPP